MNTSKARLHWGHININVSNLEQAVGFYRKQGFEPFMPAIPYLALSTDPEHHVIPPPSAKA